MIYALLTFILIQNGVIFYLLFKPTKKVVEPTIEEKEKQRLERIEKDFQKLFNYNEAIATRGYKDE
jgi:hypothetical protein